MQPNVTEKQLKELYNAVFEDEADFCDRFFNRFYHPLNVYCKTEEGKLCSALHVIDVTLKDEKRFYRAGYIFAAATYPEYRGKGYMGELIKDAIEGAKNKGTDMLFLIVAEEGLKQYYKKFGFVSVSDEEETELSASNGEVESISPEIVAELLNNEKGVSIYRTKDHIKDLLYVYGARAYRNQKGMCIAYKAGNIAVVPKYVGDISVCSEVCTTLKAEKVLATKTAGTMVLPISENAQIKGCFKLNFILN
ncbi:MAG: GNAT family N-acetyltransferase [Clostridia bacterium]|nr:GNAT family N-acetyltransferase [Clostridia bacterium]